MKRPAVNPAYLEFTRLRFLEMIAFPLDMVGRWLSFPLTLVIFYVVYGQIYQVNPDFSGQPLESLLAYLSIALAFRMMSVFMRISADVEEEIKQGDLFRYLARPINYFWTLAFRRLGSLLADLVVIAPLLYIFVTIQVGSAPHVEIFILSILLALFGGFALFQIYFITGLLAFWFEEVWGFRRGILTISAFLSGSLIPLSLMPGFLQTLSFYLPFQHQAAIPALFILGKVGIETYAQSTLILGIWIILLHFTQKYMWKKGLLKYDGKG